MQSQLPPSAQSSPPVNFNDLRDESRRRIDQPPQGRITLLARSERQQVHFIRDVSAHGVSLVLEHALEPGEPVLIEQRPAPIDIPDALPRHSAVAGSPEEARASECIYRAYVVWCRDCEPDCGAPDSHFVAGLRVHGPQSLERLVQPTKPS